jgi:hypothetical protein
MRTFAGLEGHVAEVSNWFAQLETSQKCQQITDLMPIAKIFGCLISSYL